MFKRGFFNKPAKKTAAQKEGKEEKPVKKDVLDLSTSVGGQGKPDKDASLKFPEVQESIKNTLSDSSNWMTPELAQAFASRPDLLSGMSNPKVQDAMALMSSNPKQAQEKYGNDKEVQSYMQEFSRIMGTHFMELAKKQEKGEKIEGMKVGGQETKTAPVIEKPKPQQKPLSSRKAFAQAAKNMGLSADEQKKFQDPRVIEAMGDPKVQQLIGLLRQGHPLDLRAVGQQDPQLFMRVKYLVDQGILGVAA